jgi:hypothetical protein
MGPLPIFNQTEEDTIVQVGGKGMYRPSERREFRDNKDKFKGRPNPFQNTLVVTAVPPDLNNIDKLNSHFKQFGTIVNIQVLLEYINRVTSIRSNLSKIVHMYSLVNYKKQRKLLILLNRCWETNLLKYFGLRSLESKAKKLQNLNFQNQRHQRALQLVKPKKRKQRH